MNGKTVKTIVADATGENILVLTRSGNGLWMTPPPE
jgi:hypothetical protein